MKIHSLLALTILPGLPFGQQAQPGPALPPELYRVSTSRMTFSEHSIAFVHLNTKDRTISIEWSHFPTPRHHEGRTTESTQYTTLFFPTAAVPGNAGVLYVGGTRLNGKTVVEKWVFEVPDPLPDQAEGFDRISTETILNTNALGRGHVMHMASAIGFAGVLVQHFDSRDVWVFRESTSAWSLAASPLPGTGIQVPELDDQLWTALSSRSHKVLGGFYSFRSETAPVLLLLVDANKDGILDSYQSLSPQVWASSGYSDPANFDDLP